MLNKMSDEAKSMSRFSAYIIAAVSVVFMFGRLTNQVHTFEASINALNKRVLTANEVKLLIIQESSNVLNQVDNKYYTKSRYNTIETKVNGLEERVSKLEAEVKELDYKLHANHK